MNRSRRVARSFRLDARRPVARQYRKVRLTTGNNADSEMNGQRDSKEIWRWVPYQRSRRTLLALAMALIEQLEIDLKTLTRARDEEEAGDGDDLEKDDLLEEEKDEDDKDGDDSENY